MKLNLKMLAVSTALLGLLAAGAALPASSAGPLIAAAALSLPWSAAAVESVETGSYARMSVHLCLRTATRAFGAANCRNPLPIVLPCHRVIGADGALVRLRLEPVDQDEFITRGHALSALWDLPQPAADTAPPDQGDHALRIAIDPGHGGHDPGAQVGAISEAAVMLGLDSEAENAPVDKEDERA